MAPEPLTAEQRQRVADYYPEAVRIGNNVLRWARRRRIVLDRDEVLSAVGILTIDAVRGWDQLQLSWERYAELRLYNRLLKLMAKGKLSASQCGVSVDPVDSPSPQGASSPTTATATELLEWLGCSDDEIGEILELLLDADTKPSPSHPEGKGYGLDQRRYQRRYRVRKRLREAYAKRSRDDAAD